STSVALSADGTLLAAGTSSGQVWLWRVADRTPVLGVQGHIGTVWSVALSADGQLLASGGGDRVVRLWETRTGEPLATLQGHTGMVRGVALSADGQLAASCGLDGTVRLWDTRTGRSLATLEGHTSTVWGVALSADGQLLASCGGDHTVRLWDAAHAEPGHIGDTGVRAQPSEHRSAAAPRVWRPLAMLRGHTDTVWAVTLSADGQLLGSCSGDQTVRLWDSALAEPGQMGDTVERAQPREQPMRVWRPVATLQGHAGVVRGVALSADGLLLATASEDGTVRLWEPGHIGDAAERGQPAEHASPAPRGVWQPLATLQGHTAAVWAVALSAHGQLAASCALDGAVRVWGSALAQPGHVGDWAPRAQPAEQARAAPPRVWRPLATLQGHTASVWAVALSADGQLGASSSLDGTVRLWDIRTGRLLATLQGHAAAVWAVALSADGRLVASGGGDQTVRLWESHTGRPVAILRGHTSTVYGIALSANGQLAASASEDGTVRLWGTAQAELGHLDERAERAQPAEHTGDAPKSVWRALGILEGHTSGVWAVALSADGQLVASSSLDGTARLWNSGTCQPLATLQGHVGVVRGMALSASGQLAASSSEDATVRLWDTALGEPGNVGDTAVRAQPSNASAALPRVSRPLATLQGHTASVWAVALSADGRLAASSSEDGTVRLWDTALAEPGHVGEMAARAQPSDASAAPPRVSRLLATLQGHTAAVRGVALSADGKLVISGGFDQTVRVWDATSGACLHVLRPERRYERMDITGLSGITEAQHAALLGLGAVERAAPPKGSISPPPAESARNLGTAPGSQTSV
ncbi:MAG: hypothetical protein JOZ81_01550, partial [Chloroflexi bacterium]|nr:hypothetical protein [Chloroflexota bacterium]